MRTIDMSGLNILVADSNSYMLMIIRAMLRGFGIVKIQEAADGPAALKILGKSLVDLCIVDYALTTLNGVELTEMLRSAEDSPNRYVPIVMLSAYTEKWRIESARDSGVTEFLRKPLSAAELYARLEEVIEHPRPFVRTPEYFGPDRRRSVNPKYEGPARRESDPESEGDETSTPKAGKDDPQKVGDQGTETAA